MKNLPTILFFTSLISTFIMCGFMHESILESNVKDCNSLNGKINYSRMVCNFKDNGVKKTKVYIKGVKIK